MVLEIIGVIATVLLGISGSCLARESKLALVYWCDFWCRLHYHSNRQALEQTCDQSGDRCSIRSDQNGPIRKNRTIHTMLDGRNV